MPFARFQEKIKVGNYEDSVRALGNLVMRAQLAPKVVETARRIVADCPARDHSCELEAIWQAVKYGNGAIAGLANGVRYTSDPQESDYFTGPAALLEMCARGACGEDCDGMSTLVASLAAAVGHTVGLRIWKRTKGGNYEHIYAVAAASKQASIANLKSEANVISLDTSTVNQPGFDLGFNEAPPFGFVKTYWIQQKDR